MSDGLGDVTIETLLAIVAVASFGVVSALDTHSSTHLARQLVELHVEATLACMQITVTGCNTYYNSDMS